MRYGRRHGHSPIRWASSKEIMRRVTLPPLLLLIALVVTAAVVLGASSPPVGGRGPTAAAAVPSSEPTGTADLGAVASAEPTPSPEPSEAYVVSANPALEPSPNQATEIPVSPSASSTSTPASTPKATATATATATPGPTPTPKPAATATPTPTPKPTATPKPAPTYRTSTPFATWEVPVGDIGSLGSPRTNVIVKAFSPGMNVVKYLDTAQAHGQKVVLYFMDTVDYSTGTVHPDKVAAWVNQVKSHPAVYGYLSVKEPSWNGISVSEMRSLYKAYRAADAHHPVIALLGDIPHFGTSANPWASGISNILWVDWYPVTYSRGYIATASTWFPKVRAYVNKVTPGTPIWLQIQGHGYRAGDRRTPTSAEFTREVRDGFTYLKADGIVFYPWNIPTYDSDLKRNSSLWSTARSIVAHVRAGTF